MVNVVLTIERLRLLPLIFFVEKSVFKYMKIKSTKKLEVLKFAVYLLKISDRFIALYFAHDQIHLVF